MPKNPEKTQTQKKEKFPRKAAPNIDGGSEEATARNFAKLTTSSVLAAYRVIQAAEQKSGLGARIDVPTLLDQLRSESEAVNKGDLGQVEAVLMNQAIALQSLFARLAERGMGCDHALAFEMNMRMALRAQNQCRATLETLSAIKNPPVVYAKQANVTTGPQQVNNGAPLSSRARKTKNEQTQLSEVHNELLPDTRTPGTASPNDPPVETVGEIDRTNIRSR